MIIFRNFRNLVCESLHTPLRFSQYRELRGITKTVKILNDENEKHDDNKYTLQKQDHSDDMNLADLESERISSLASTEIINSALKKSNSEDQTRFDPLAPVDPKDPPDSSVSNFIPTFNFAAYINQSESLQQLLKLGVDLSKIEKRKGLTEFVLKLDFEKDIKSHLIFLNDHGVLAENLGEFITKNPLIFKINLDDLQTRINYLEVKKFKNTQIQRIITLNPFWLMFSTRRIDQRLGYFQQNFHLSGDDIRFLTTKQPRLITYNMEHIQKNSFSIKEEMGFDEDEIKCLLLSKPKLWITNSDELIERFHYIHKVMKISHQAIVQTPEILTSREFRIRQRHEFLKKLGKAQYDPGKDLYVSLKKLIEGTDRDFVLNVAKSDLSTYNNFLRTL